jgi:non-ribosomal peptide synthetase component F
VVNLHHLLLPVHLPSLLFMAVNRGDMTGYILRGVPTVEALIPPPQVETLADLFEFQAQARGDAPLFTFASTTLGYATVYKRVLSSSSALVKHHLKESKGAVVGVWLERSLELHLSILTVAFAGAGWLPFDADAPAARVNACLQDSNASVLLCDQAHFDAAQEATKGTSATVVLWEVLEKTASQSTADCRIHKPRSQDTAYLIYTSGSSGTPKGIEISHGAALTFALSEQSVLGTTTSDVVWQGFSAAFDMFVEET